ncbi:hypothetical protein ACUNHW_25485, partial [Serratia sp. IR-2025]
LDQIIITPPVVTAHASNYFARHALRHPAAQVWGVATMNFLLPASQRISLATPGATEFIVMVPNIRKLAIQIALRLCCTLGVDL